MSKPLKNVREASSEAGAQHDVAVAAAVELAMEFYGCDAVTAAAKRAFEARDLNREGHYLFWLHVFKSLKSNPGLINQLLPVGLTRRPPVHRA